MAPVILEKPKHVDVDEKKIESSSAPTEVAANKDEAEPMDVDYDVKRGIKHDGCEPDQDAKEMKLIKTNEKGSEVSPERSGEPTGGRAKRSPEKGAERSPKQLRMDRDSRDGGGIGRRDSGPLMGRLGDRGDHRGIRPSRDYGFRYGSEGDANDMDDRCVPRRLPSRTGGQQNDYGEVRMRNYKDMPREREVSRADRERRDGDRRGSGVLGRIGDRRSFGHREHAERRAGYYNENFEYGRDERCRGENQAMGLKNCVGGVGDSMYLLLRGSVEEVVLVVLLGVVMVAVVVEGTETATDS